MVDESDDNNVIWGLLSYFIGWPFLGLILWLVFKLSNHWTNARAALAGTGYVLLTLLFLLIDLLLLMLVLAVTWPAWAKIIGALLVFAGLIASFVYPIYLLVIHCENLN